MIDPSYLQSEVQYQLLVEVRLKALASLPNGPSSSNITSSAPFQL